jgi:methyl-accepting chemotaxis protein
VEKLNEISRQVKTGAGQMLEGSREVIRESRRLEAVTQGINQGVNEMAAGVDQINIAVDRVNGISGENRRLIDRLADEMAKFKVN